MPGFPSSSGNGADLSLAPVLDKLRRDNALTDEVVDPGEDEPHIVGIPKKFQRPADAEKPHS